MCLAIARLQEAISGLGITAEQVAENVDAGYNRNQPVDPQVCCRSRGCIDALAPCTAPRQLCASSLLALACRSCPKSLRSALCPRAGR